MVKFLLNKPIAVTMTFIAIMIVGLVSTTRIPVSLMPDVAIPEITVQISEANTSARELENSVVRPIRQQLMQVAHLDDIKSETTDGNGTIKLKFNYGTNIDFAFIEVNEKVDRAMNYLPRSIGRPRIIKASVGDIPVFYLNLTLKKTNSENYQDQDHKSQNVDSAFSLRSPVFGLQSSVSNELYPVSQSFVELSRFASNVISKRLEQLPEVAMVDMSGLAKTEILIMPDLQKMEALGVTLDQLEQKINSNNIKLGNLSIRDGQYLYNVRFASSLQNKQAIEDIWLKTDTRLYQLKEIATVIDHPQKPKGLVLSNGQEAITMAVIKQSDAQMNNMKKSLKALVAQFENDYPDIEFEITRDQTKLLDYSISNLAQSLWQGALLAFLMLFFFLRDTKSPFLIGITIPITFVVCLLLFYLVGLSVNIISLSGLILGVGMMSDNAIVVIDNITQHYQRSLQSLKGSKDSPLETIEALRLKGLMAKPFEEFESEASKAKHRKRSIESETSNVKPQTLKLITQACISGTNEVIGPMLSSVFTNCAVFLPLIFLSGISGALFYDQAVAIAIGAVASWAVSITIIPVYYLMIFKRGKGFGENKWLKRINGVNYEAVYEKGFRYFMKHQVVSFSLIALFILGAVLLFIDLPKSKLPVIEKDEVVVSIDWNSPVNIFENRQRVEDLLEKVNPYVNQSTCLVGEQQFLLDKNSTGNSTRSVIYLKGNTPQIIDSITTIVKAYLSNRYTESVFSFQDADNIFNVIFSDAEPNLEARLKVTDDYGPAYNSHLQAVCQKIKQETDNLTLPEINWQEHLVLTVSPEKLMLYGVNYQLLYTKLKSLFSENQLFQITDNTDFVPVVLGGKPQVLRKIIDESYIQNNQGENIPIRELLVQSVGKDLKSIVAGKEGEYYPLALSSAKPKEVMDKIQSVVKPDGRFEVSFTGRYFSNKKMIGELFVILLISLALLYFILASQFESLVLPLIILIEVPLDLFGAFLFLKLCGAGINLMSLIGIIVMAGIVVNDSILKIDTINQLRQEGYGLIRSILTAGQRRLKPILMTALSTILGLSPILFSNGLGADLQRPLALSNIGGMIVGTFISLYIIPLLYYYLNKKRKVVC